MKAFIVNLELPRSPSYIWIFYGSAVALASLLMVHGETGDYSPTQMRSKQKPNDPGLKCYYCADESSNDNCSRDSNLKTCNPTIHASNVVCSTKITSSPERGYRISKSCETGPCELGLPSAMALGFHQQCDQSKPSWTCSSCCTGDGCNKNTASQNAKPKTVLPVLIIMLLPSGTFLGR